MAPACFAYLDEIIVATNTFQDHLKYLTIVFTRLMEAELQVNRNKCEFGCSELSYLGFLVNENGLQVDPTKVNSVLTFPLPKDVKELRSFLGLASWYRRFISNFSTIASPINKLLRKKEKWYWGVEQDLSSPWATVASDIMGPLPCSTKGFNYLLVFEDLFTKWVELIPIRTANAAAVAKCFKENVLYQWGYG